MFVEGFGGGSPAEGLRGRVLRASATASRSSRLCRARSVLSRVNFLAHFFGVSV